MNENELPDRLRRLVERAQPVDFDEVIHRRPVRGARPLVVALAAVAVLALVAGAVALLRIDRHDAAPMTTDPPATTVPAVDAVPVWYDGRGLHHGDVVEQTPVEIMQQVGDDSVAGALALVRSGAVYLDPATGDVWFHPWGGEPRIVGHDSAAGPGGDPNGDTAAWFDGSDLVVYDTAAGREISRTPQGQNVVSGSSGIGGDHFPAGNGFLQVSAERVVWSTGPGVFSHDPRTRTTSVFEFPEGRYLADVHDQVEVFGTGEAPVVSVPGRADVRLTDLEPHLRLSPSGDEVLGVEATEERHAAAIVDTRTGELWPVPRNAYPWIAWSYGDIALVDTEDALLACDAARRACAPLPAERPFLMPTN